MMPFDLGPPGEKGLVSQPIKVLKLTGGFLGPMGGHGRQGSFHGNLDLTPFQFPLEKPVQSHPPPQGLDDIADPVFPTPADRDLDRQGTVFFILEVILEAADQFIQTDPVYAVGPAQVKDDLVLGSPTARNSEALHDLGILNRRAVFTG